MTETTPATSAQLKGQAQETTRDATALAERRSSIDQEIHALREEIKAERLRLARNGQDISTPTLDAELEALLAEREDLPERHFATLERAQGLHIQAEGAKIEELAQPIVDAKAEFDRAEEVRKAAEATAKEAEAKLGSLRQTRYVAKERRKHAEHELTKLADAGVRPMAQLD